MILLTIAIPTYNRAEYLDICLNSIITQYQHHGVVEILISNNHSTDNTDDIVSKYRQKGLEIVYVVNKENIGPDRNFAQCFLLAKGKYVWIFGDDDVLLDKTLEKIMRVLRDDNYGVLYLNSYGFKTDYLSEMPKPKKIGTSFYSDHIKFFNKINYWMTFVSGNIVNKSLLSWDFDPFQFVDTNLVQLNWVITAAFRGKENVVIDDYIVAFRIANTGGYKLCNVFGENMNLIFDHFIKLGYDRKVFICINRKLLQTFFPNLIIISRKRVKGFNFDSEDYYVSLRRIFAGYASFWLVTVPVIKLPARLAKIWFLFISKFLG